METVEERIKTCKNKLRRAAQALENANEEHRHNRIVLERRMVFFTKELTELTALRAKEDGS